MKSIYWCKKCDEFLEEEKTPNINRRHDERCGESLKLIRYDE